MRLFVAPILLYYPQVPAFLSLALVVIELLQPSAVVAPVAQRFEARYRASSTLQATFLEKYSEGGRVTRAEAGVAYFRRPGRMRWEYDSPEKNLFLVDGKWAWFFVPADHTVTRVLAKHSNDWRTPVALLANNPKLSRICAEVAPSETVPALTPGDSVLFCLLRGSEPAPAKKSGARLSARALEEHAAAQGDAIFMEIQTQTGVLARVLVTQPARVSIEFQFTRWQFDPPLSESLFRFEPPVGVAIVDGDLSPTGPSK